MVPESHPLREFFVELVDRHYCSQLELRDEQVRDYIAAMLTEFCEVEQLLKIKNADQRPLQDVGEMLLESNPVFGPAPSFDRERQVRKHIGDYTLFYAGMFPESINHFRMRRQRLENFVDLMKAGKESYFIVSTFDCFEYAKVAPLFRKLSDRFEECVFALNQVKSDLQEMQHPIYQRTTQFLM